MVDHWNSNLYVVNLQHIKATRSVCVLCGIICSRNSTQGAAEKDADWSVTMDLWLTTPVNNSNRTPQLFHVTVTKYGDRVVTPAVSLCTERRHWTWVMQNRGEDKCVSRKNSYVSYVREHRLGNILTTTKWSGCSKKNYWVFTTRKADYVNHSWLVNFKVTWRKNPTSFLWKILDVGY